MDIMDLENDEIEMAPAHRITEKVDIVNRNEIRLRMDADGPRDLIFKKNDIFDYIHIHIHIHTLYI